MTTPELSTTAAVLSVLRRGDDDYADAARTLVGEGYPELVVRPRSAAEVAAAMHWAGESGMALTVRSAGHSMAGLSRATEGLLLDLRGMADIAVDPATRIARIGGGATWGEVAAALHPHGLGITAGDTAGVGVGGLTLGGGIGWMVRRYGLAIDSLVGAQVVTAAGEILEVSADVHPDLFWSVRGGGAGSGVVTRFDFRAQQVTEVVFGTIVLDPSDPVRLLTGWRDAQCGADERLTTVLSLMPAMGDRPGMAMVQVCFDGPEAEGQAAIDQLLRLAPVLSSDLSVRPYAEVLEDAHMPPGARVTATNTFLDLDAAAVAALGDLYAGGGTVVSVRSLGGAVARVPVGETAFAHRTAEAMAVALRFLPGEPGPDDAVIPGWQAVAEHGSGRYLNFSSAADESALAAAYPPATRERLAQIRAEHDPDGLLSARGAA
ncbi:FAD-binding oxidoreductase [Ruania zhangjianzhongii]|uniref:FAD-binding oxidoreductase n=1 Tax=Ruania zhangjianzhongii TaxID=2603206 RepID=UPI0011C72395|nr:FAD-dependent oxidoreductase [Ruania zhangjianzhongii]